MTNAIQSLPEFSSLCYGCSRHTVRGILLHLIAAWFASGAIAAAATPTTWGVSNVVNTAISSPGQSNVIALSSTGEVFQATGPFYASGACTSPTQSLGDPSTQYSCVTKFNASGQIVFRVQLGGGGVEALALGPSGDIFIAGAAGPSGAGFATTSGAYEATPPGVPDPFLCRLSGADGHAVFCTYIDVSVVVAAGLAVDSSNNSYVSGLCTIQVQPGSCIEKIDSTGEALVFNTVVTNGAAIALDASGDLYCLCGGLVELNSSGTITASTPVDGEYLISLALDPSGNPEILLQDTANLGTFRLQKYIAGRTQMLFDTSFYAGAGSFSGASTPTLAVDSSGVADIVGAAPGVNLTQVNPTQTCAISSGEGANAFLVRMDSNGNLLQSTYLNLFVGCGLGGPVQTNLALTNTGALAAFWSLGTNVTTMNLAPTTAGVALACLGNGASFANMPIAPNEIVSAFGAGLGPATPIMGQPDAANVYGTELGGVQITFDGIASTLLYSSDGQVNLVTPAALNGKTSTQVCALVNGQSTNCLTLPVQPAAPGIFTSSVFYNGQFSYAAAVNQDGTINSEQNPAASGSVVSLYVTGLGATTPSLADGSITPLPLPSQDLTVLIDSFIQDDPEEGLLPGGDAQVTYAGPAPLEIEGLGQININVGSLGSSQLESFEVFVSDGTQGYLSEGVLIWIK